MSTRATSPCSRLRGQALLPATAASIRCARPRRLPARSPPAASSPAARRSPCRSRACSRAARAHRRAASCARSRRALQLEQRSPRTQILALYLRLAPFGGNLEGVRAASLAYFGKEPRRLSLGEAALLVALPQSPEARRPDRTPAAPRARPRPRAAAAVGAGVIAAERGRRATPEPHADRAPRVPRARPAPRRRRGRRGAARRASASPDHRPHRFRPALEALVARAAPSARHRSCRPPSSSPITRTGEVLAHVGSAGYLDAGPPRRHRHGRRRALAGLDAEALHLRPRLRGRPRPSRDAHRGPADALRHLRAQELRPGLPRHGDDPRRRSAIAQHPGRRAAGRRRPRQARSRRLRRAGVEPRAARAEPAGARHGARRRRPDACTISPRSTPASPAAASRRRSAPRATPRSRRGPARPRACCRRSPPGTSPTSCAAPRRRPTPRPGASPTRPAPPTAIRDAWAIGYDGNYVIAVWFGRPDGASTPGLAGRIAAAPMLFDAFARLSPAPRAAAPAPAGALTVAGSALPPPLKRFREARVETAAGTVPRAAPC